MLVISVFQGYGLIHNTYKKAIGHENQQTKDKEDAIWCKPEEKWKSD